MWNTNDFLGKVLQETYRIERLIGEGGMGVVFEASHQRLIRRFAIKILFPSVASRPDSLARFRREAQITSALGNPHIVEVIDFNKTAEGANYIVMELLDGEDLELRLRSKGRFDLEPCAAVFKQIASALSAAHEKGIIHRDLKPQNIFLCRVEGRDDYVKVVDFGISKVLGSSSVVTRTNTVMGSPAYMSPEQAEGHTSSVDQRTDVYAMGTIVYEMLAGRPPFIAESIPTLLYHVVHKEAPRLEQIQQDVPGAVAEVVHRAMAKKTADRHQSMADFWQAFDEALALGEDQTLMQEMAPDAFDDQPTVVGAPAPPFESTELPPPSGGEEALMAAAEPAPLAPLAEIDAAELFNPEVSVNAAVMESCVVVPEPEFTEVDDAGQVGPDAEQLAEAEAEATARAIAAAEAKIRATRQPPAPDPQRSGLTDPRPRHRAAATGPQPPPASATGPQPPPASATELRPGPRPPASESIETIISDGGQLYVEDQLPDLGELETTVAMDDHPPPEVALAVAASQTFAPDDIDPAPHEEPPVAPGNARIPAGTSPERLPGAEPLPEMVATAMTVPATSGGTKRAPLLLIGGVLLVGALAAGGVLLLGGDEGAGPGPASEPRTPSRAEEQPAAAAEKPQAAATPAAHTTPPDIAPKTAASPPPDIASKTAASSPPDIALKTAATTRALTLDSVPPGARVFLENKPLGTTPLSGLQIPAGKLTLRVRKAGHITRQLALEPGTEPVKSKLLLVRLVRRKAVMTTLRVATLAGGSPISADIYIDGKKRGQSPLFLKEIRVGIHLVEARLSGFRASRKRSRLRPDKVNSVVLKLSR